MDVIKITHPTTWAGEDNPADYMCLLSLREAINERASYVGMSWNCPPILPHLPYNRDVMVAMQTALYRLIPYFVNHEFKDYAKDLSDFPRMWSLSDLVTAEHNIALMPSPGSLSEVWSEWLKAMKYIIGKLTHIPFSNYGGEVVTGSGSIHDPPFDESISEAIKKALENKTKHTFEELPLTFGTWSGNTHYSHNSEADTKDGYCGYAELNAIHPKLCEKVLVATNSKYNQDYSDKCLLIEVGDNAVTVEEACNAAEYVAIAIGRVLAKEGTVFS